MDVFLEEQPRGGGSKTLLERLVVAPPLQAATHEDLIKESAELESRRIRFVTVRRQQVSRIGEQLLRHVLEEHGVRICCLGFAGGFTGSLGLSYPAAVADTRKAISLAADLNATSLVIVPGERGRHTYRHAERTVRDGLCDCLESSESSGVRLLIPTDTLLPGTNDCFRPRLCPLEWVQQLNCQMIRPMIVVREATNVVDLPAMWRLSLDTGGFLRICPRSPGYERKTRLVGRVIETLVRAAAR